MKSTFRLNIIIFDRKAFYKWFLISNMWIIVVDSHFRKYSLHFTCTLMSNRVHFCFRNIYFYNWTEYIIVIVDENYLNSLRFYFLGIFDDIFKGILKFDFFSLQCPPHFFLLCKHTIYLDICIFLNNFYGANTLFFNLLSMIFGTIKYFGIPSLFLFGLLCYLTTNITIVV